MAPGLRCYSPISPRGLESIGLSLGFLTGGGVWGYPVGGEGGFQAVCGGGGGAIEAE